MAVLEEKKSRDVFEALQELYEQLLNETRFRPEIHESYSTIIDTLVEQYAAVSFRDWICGRQKCLGMAGAYLEPVEEKMQFLRLMQSPGFLVLLTKLQLEDQLHSH
ncbi:hypothetical protein PTKIN_Ptkin02bG0218700 [Pterospermum kingtungense]